MAFELLRGGYVNTMQIAQLVDRLPAQPTPKRRKASPMLLTVSALLWDCTSLLQCQDSQPRRCSFRGSHPCWARSSEVLLCASSSLRFPCIATYSCSLIWTQGTSQAPGPSLYHVDDGKLVTSNLIPVLRWAPLFPSDHRTSALIPPCYMEHRLGRVLVWLLLPMLWSPRLLLLRMLFVHCKASALVSLWIDSCCHCGISIAGLDGLLFGCIWGTGEP